MQPKILIIAGIILAVITAAGGFVGGMAYTQGQAQNSIATFQQQRAAGQNGTGAVPQGGNVQALPGGSGQGRGGPNAQFGAPVASGQIKSVNGDTIEISTADSVVTIKVNDQTIISKTDRGTVSDLQAGDRVTVFSQEAGDTPVASSIQLQSELPAPAQTPPGNP